MLLLALYGEKFCHTIETDMVEGAGQGMSTMTHQNFSICTQLWSGEHNNIFWSRLQTFCLRIINPAAFGYHG